MLALLLLTLGSPAPAAELSEAYRYLQRVQASLSKPAPSAAAEGLPAELPGNYLETGGFVRFQELSPEESRRIRNLPENIPSWWEPGRPRFYAPAPIGGLTYLDDERVTDPRQLERVFDAEPTFVRIPAKVGVRRDEKGREHWDFPVGTEFVHLILIKASPARVYELRLVRRLPDGWAFGSYSPRDLSDPRPAATLVLNRYEGNPVVQFPVRSAAEGRTIGVRISRIRLASCQGCHLANSIGDYQYFRHKPDGALDVPASVRASGACGFAPANPAARAIVSAIK